MTEPSLISSEALPRGFRFAAVKAGIKPSGKADFAVALADSGASAVGNVHVESRAGCADHRWDAGI
jgi:N-acetylglutamate synthase/N-acetylornithine aminotransferase